MIGIVAVVEVGEGVLSHSVDLPPLMICVVTEMHILDALDYIVDKSVEFKLGARGLRAICEEIMMDAMFELPSGDTKEFTVTPDYAAHKLERVDMKVLKAS